MLREDSLGSWSGENHRDMEWRLDDTVEIHSFLSLLVLSREWMGMEEWDDYYWWLWIIPLFPAKHQ